MRAEGSVDTEQERIAALETVNGVLLESASRLGAKDDPGAFLGFVTAELARVTGAFSVHAFRYDSARRELRLELSFIDGRLRPGPSGDELPIWGAPFPVDVTPAWKLMVEHRAVFTPEFTPIPAEEFAWPGAIEWLARIGASDAAHVVCFAGDEPVGSLGLAFTQGRRLAAKDRTLIQALAQQAGVALRLVCLADEARARAVEAAVALEREKATQERLAKVARTNEALRASVESLVHVEDVDRLLGNVLLAMTRELGARSSTVWLDDYEAQLSTLKFVVEDGVLRSAEDSHHPNARKPAAIVPGDRAQVMPGSGTGRAAPVLTPVDTAVTLTEEQKAYLRALGVKALLGVPILLHARQIGIFSIRLENDARALHEEELELLQSLAHQAALAIELRRLAKETEALAVSREKERGAAERARELALTNEAMRSTTALLASQPQVGTFVGQALLEAARRLDAVSSCLFLRDAASGHFRLRATCYAHELVDPYEDPRYTDWRAPFPEAEFPSWAELGARREMFLSVGPENDHHCPRGMAWHRREGHRSVLLLGLVLGDRPKGFLSFAFSSGAAPSRERVELAHALSQQMALAIQLTDLGEEARQSAVLAERGRIAGEIHDSLAQSFSGIALQLETAEDALASSETEIAAACVHRAKQLARFGLSEARRSVLTLRPATTLRDGLDVALSELAKRSQVPEALACRFATVGVPYTLDGELQLELFRIAQEAVSNAVRHAEPSKLAIALEYATTQTVLTVADDGKGMERDASVTESAGQGLRSMRERAERLGGSFVCESVPGKGTTIVVRVPKRAPSKARGS